MYVAYSLKSVVGLLYELLLSCFIPVVYAHSPNYKKAVCLFFKPDFNFLTVLFVVDANVFILLGVGLGDVALNFELVLQKLMKVVVIQRNIAGKLVLPDYSTVF